MSFLYFFDYIFYRICGIYHNVIGYKDKGTKTFGGVSGVSLIQTINLMAIISFILPLNKIDDQNLTLAFLTSFILLFALNYYRYVKFAPIEKIEIRYVSESFKSKRIKGYGIIFYWIISIFIKNPC